MAENLILVLRVLKASEIGDLGFVIDISCDSYLSIIDIPIKIALNDSQYQLHSVLYHPKLK